MRRDAERRHTMVHIAGEKSHVEESLHIGGRFRRGHRVLVQRGEHPGIPTKSQVNGVAVGRCKRNRRSGQVQLDECNAIGSHRFAVRSRLVTR